MHLSKLTFSRSLAALFVILPGAAQAHPGSSALHGFGQGIAHPIFGLDHLLAILAVGIWAGQRGGKAFRIMPVTFLAAMTLGVLAGVGHQSLPFVESGISLSVLILGILIAAASRMPIGSSAALVGVFAFFHGHAHGSEMAAGAGGLVFGLGILLTTALLQLGGMAIGRFLCRQESIGWARLAGGSFALCGVCFFLS